MTKADDSNKDWIVGLMKYINTPISGLYLSPTWLLFVCRLKTKLPISLKVINVELFTDLTEEIVKRQKTPKLYYGRGSTNLRQFHGGDDVTMYDFNTKAWTPSNVISRSNKL
ncbi:uncharacterized protein K02A2.6 [Trichonephila clavata]|uniref:Uncharacterized protein K02A2.6 n=1 Tax=Trichonephila clavata TaxID=2740835 RepID=A0A8X6KYK5_TRICU|nr:uncharacterized protein K02A2.6 [Trichonephila clavata]